MKPSTVTRGALAGISSVVRAGLPWGPTMVDSLPFSSCTLQHKVSLVDDHVLGVGALLDQDGVTDSAHSVVDLALNRRTDAPSFGEGVTAPLV